MRPSTTDHDAAGNLLADGLGNTFTWDANEMISSSNGTNYYYDAEGDRVGKSGSAPTDTIYFGGRPVARLAGGAWTDLIYGAGGLLAEVPGTQTGAPLYRMTDPLGSSVGTLSSTGALSGSIQDYAPFGELFNGSSTTDPYKFTGKERDAESGNDYFGARYYASTAGRWLSPDPIFGEANRVLDPQQWNMYAYARNNPLSITDPSGMDFNLKCSDGDPMTCNSGYQGQYVYNYDSNQFEFERTKVTMNDLTDPSAGYKDQFGEQYTGTFDQDKGVSFTNTTTGVTSSHSQFINGSDPTQLIGAPGSAFAGMKANFFDACGSSSSCQGRFTLYGTKDQFQIMESTLQKQGKFKTLVDGLSFAHPFNTDQWKGGGPNNNYVHMIKAPGYHMDGHFEGSTDAGLHAFGTIKDLFDAAFGERGKLIPGNDY